MSALPSPASDLEACLAALVRLALAPDAPQAALWRESLDAARSRLRATADDAAAGKIDGLWTLAVKEAEHDPAVRSCETVNPVLPSLCPISRQELMARDFDLDATITSLRSNASFG